MIVHKILTQFSKDDDAMPASFFDETTGSFVDSLQTRVRAKLVVNFGNPYKEKRGDSLIPMKFLSQTPAKRGGIDSQKSPYRSPPHDSFDSVEEGEAMFVQEVRKSPSRTSPSRTSPSRSYEAAEKTMVPPKQPPPPPKRPQQKENSQEAALFSKIGDSDANASYENSAVKPMISKPPPPKPKVPPPAATKSLKPVPPPPPKSKPKPPPPKPPSHAKTFVETSGTPPIFKKIERSGSNESASSGSSSTSEWSAKTPVTIQETKKPTAQVESAASEAAKNDLENPDLKPDVVLPPGWLTVWSKSQKRWYFFDTKANKSVWQWPP